MELAKSGEIQNVCYPNALMTLQEYAMDYGDEEFKTSVENMIDKQIINIKREDIRKLVLNNLDRIRKGERDLYL